jgi:hypothetical protein
MVREANGKTREDRPLNGDSWKDINNRFSEGDM